MVIEGRDLVHLRHRQLHFVRERHEMSCREAAEAILNQMQMLDQQIASTRPVTEQQKHLVAGFWLDLAASRGRAGSSCVPGHLLVILFARRLRRAEPRSS